MVRIDVRGVGNSLDDATDDLYQSVVETAEESGLVAPKRVAGARRYVVLVRKQHQRFVAGRPDTNIKRALSSALTHADLAYDPANHRLRIDAIYDLPRAAAAARGTPSGAAPSMYRTGPGLEDRALL